MIEAVETEEIPIAVYENFQKMIREQEHFSSSIKEKREKGKAKGKLYKAILNDKKRSKPF